MDEQELLSLHRRAGEFPVVEAVGGELLVDNGDMDRPHDDIDVDRPAIPGHKNGGVKVTRDCEGGRGKQWPGCERAGRGGLRLRHETSFSSVTRCR
jgi:hypothetical protein